MNPGTGLGHVLVSEDGKYRFLVVTVFPESGRWTIVQMPEGETPQGYGRTWFSRDNESFKREEP